MAKLASPLRSVGISLIELMIAIALGLFVVAGLYTMLSSNQRTYSAIRINTQMADSERRVELVMEKMLNQTGFRNYARVRDKEQIPPQTVSGANGTTQVWLEGQSMIGVDNSSGVAGVKDGTDTITIRFYGSSKNDMDPSLPSTTDADGTIVDCHGTARSRNDLVIMTLFIDASDNLNCYDNLNNDNVTMDTGVENLQIRYKLLGDTDNYAAAPSSASTTWRQIKVIEYALLVAKPYKQGMNNSVTTYNLLGTTVNTATDGKLRQILSGSNMMRNQDFTLN